MLSVASDTLLSSGGRPHPRDIVDAAKVALVATAAVRQSRPIGHSLIAVVGTGRTSFLSSESPVVRSSLFTPPSIYLCIYLSLCLSRALSLYESVFVRRGLQCSVASAAAPTSEGRARSERGTDGLRRTNAPRQLHSTLHSTRRSPSADFLALPSPSHNFLRSRQPLE